MRFVFCMICSMCLLPWSSSGEDGAMSQLDKEVLATLFRDSVSPMHSHLPVGRTFGIPGLAPNDQLDILKTGKKILFVSQLTGEVYRPMSARGGYVRLDKNNIFGLEYQVDPFLRRDSLFMVATSRFMKGKGFIAFFDEASGEWRPYRSNDKIIKESTRPFYDAVKDRLYLVCDYVYDEQADSTTKTMDHILRFSFSSGQWEDVGRLDKEVFSSAVHVPLRMIWEASFGAGSLEEGDLYVLQPALNRWMGTDSTFRTGMYARYPLFSDTAHVLQMIHMGDTLHSFIGTPDSVQVVRFALRESDFTVVGGKALYEEVVVQQKDQLHRPWTWALALTGLAALALAGSRFLRRPARKAAGSVTDASTIIGSSVTAVTEPVVPAKQPVHYFLDSLTSVERALVLELSAYAIKGEMMDTQALNQMLGVSQKEPELQKVRRSLTITRINSNFSQMLEPDVALIRRSKDPADKRVFLYYVTPEHAQQLLTAEGQAS